MADLSAITALETGGPPPGLGPLATLRWSATHPDADPTVSFAGKTVLVTGANTGLGFEAAVKYAALGADKLVLAVRTLAKGEQAKQRIIQRTGRHSDAIVVLTVDLGDFASVRSFIQALAGETQYLDVALLNAGLGNPTFEKSPAGWEMALQVNVLSTTLMAVLLLPLLRATAEARGTPPHLTFVNSHGHFLVQRDWFSYADGSLLRAANDPDKFDVTRSYAMVKLLAMAAVQAIARAAAGAGGPAGGPRVIVNAVCPSLCKTDLGRNFAWYMHIPMFFFQAVFARTAEGGARSLVSATTLGPESHGRFWHLDILHPLGALAKDEALMQQSWSEIWEVVAHAQPDLQQILDGRG